MMLHGLALDARDMRLALPTCLWCLMEMYVKELFIEVGAGSLFWEAGKGLGVVRTCLAALSTKPKELNCFPLLLLPEHPHSPSTSYGCLITSPRIT